ncbi:Asp/Glu racemase [Devosia sediminis]|uniref:Asp/Glu racemase n=1 Tax=Devosia sediminis TaxID=2798801 RepID=A0A934IXM3_9HYPH|nr:Asp/Glu racemase [Devosia sediminis]MBJ3783809.1 Asp/Glu racemase [Devosia sediminis]
MIRIACLHTAPSNVAVLEAAAAAIRPGALALSHTLRADLLADMEAAGGLTADIRARGSAAIDALLADHDGVLITCSSLGALANGASVQRVDAALARAAVRSGRAVTVLCASPTTVRPTTDLFAAAAVETGAVVDTRMVDGAWPLFRGGDVDAYLHRIAEAAAMALSDGADVVALAQVSMSGAAELVVDPRGRVLASPAAALQAWLDSVT